MDTEEISKFEYFIDGVRTDIATIELLTRIISDNIIDNDCLDRNDIYLISKLMNKEEQSILNKFDNIEDFIVKLY